MKMNSIHYLLIRSFLILILFIVTNFSALAQMPPPGYERAKKIQEEQMKVSILDRDSLTLTDTVEIFDPTTYESEFKIVSTRFSIRDYCLKYLAIGNADILLDRNPHTVIDPKTYEDITIRLNASGKIDTIPK